MSTTTIRATTRRCARRLPARPFFREPRQGKGNVVRRMFADIEADIYLMADGDGTYSPEDARTDQHAADRARSTWWSARAAACTTMPAARATPSATSIFNRLYQTIFGRDFTDIFSGYRAFSRRFVKSFPAVSGGFEIETEMSVHASRLKLPVCELELDYGRRPEGSHSKLSTFRRRRQDPLDVRHADEGDAAASRFFGTFRALFMASSLTLMTPVLIEYLQTGLVPRMPTWMLSMVLLMLSIMMVTAG